MEIENKKFRCHGSIVIEQSVRLIFWVVLIFIANLGDIIAEGITLSRDEIFKAIVVSVAVLAVLMVLLVLAIIRWRKTTIVIEEDAIVWERNTINKKELTIGIKNISTINIERNIFERIIGTAKLKIDTNSTSTADETDVMFLFKYDDAVKYKEHLEKKVRMAAGNEAEYEEIPVESGDVKSNFEKKVRLKEEQVTASYTSGGTEILKHCFYDMSVTAVVAGIAVTICGIWSVMAETETESIGAKEIFAIIVMAIAFLTPAFSATIGKFFTFYNLTVSRKGNRLYMKYGMFKVREYVIPVEKISAVYIKQSMISRIFKRFNVSVECIGLNDEAKETAQLTLSLPYGEYKERLSHLLPECDITETISFDYVDKKVFYHKVHRLIIFTVIVVGFVMGEIITTESIWDNGIGWLIFWGATILLIYVRIILGIILQMRTEGMGFGSRNLSSTSGTFTKEILIVPYDKIQYISAKSSPISKFTGLYKSEINIQAGILKATKSISHITKEKVEMLREKICGR